MTYYSPNRAWRLEYIHTQCAYDIFCDSDEKIGTPLDLFAMLEGFLDNAPAEEGVSFRFFLPSHPEHSISDSWRSQGY